MHGSSASAVDAFCGIHLWVITVYLPLLGQIVEAMQLMEEGNINDLNVEHAKLTIHSIASSTWPIHFRLPAFTLPPPSATLAHL